MKLVRILMQLALFFATFGACLPAGAQTGNIKTVWIILMENHNWSQIKGSSSAPYINNTLLPMASHAEQYFNPPGIHPSLPNYLWLEAGTNFSVLCAMTCMTVANPRATRSNRVIRGFRKISRPS
jgi:hypothetical protein